MKRSTYRILTTHAGSLARPADLLEIVRAKEAGRPYNQEAFAARVRTAVLPLGIVSRATHSRSAGSNPTSPSRAGIPTRRSSSSVKPMSASAAAIESYTHLEYEIRVTSLPLRIKISR